MTLNALILSRLAFTVTAIAFLGLSACGEKPSEPAPKDERAAAAAVNGDASKSHDDAEDGHSHAPGEKDAH